MLSGAPNGEIYVRESQTVLKNFGCTLPKNHRFLYQNITQKIRNNGNVDSYVFGRDVFAIFGHLIGHLAVSDEQMVRWKVFR